MVFEESQIFKEQSEPPLCTITGEFYQPARIYYQVGQKNAVLGRFKRLRCIDFDSTKNRWVWLYTEEAKNIEFTNSYRDIPKEHRPIVLGSFTFNGDKELRLDVRSFERVIEAILFFDQKINRRLAQITKLKIVNKLFPTTLDIEAMSAHHTLFFEQHQAINPKDEIKQLEEIISQYKEGEERQKAAFDHFEQQMKKTLPEVEELETYFYEDGIESLKMLLQMRQIEALEHWKGNKNFSQFDLMETLIENLDNDLL